MKNLEVIREVVPYSNNITTYTIKLDDGQSLTLTEGEFEELKRDISTTVSINDLISIANYSIEETVVPPYEKIVEQFSSTWEDMYLDESLKDDEGKHCYIIWDDCNNCIRSITVAEELNDNTKINLLDIMDNVIFDLLFNDIVDEIAQDENAEHKEYGMRYNEDYAELLDYIDTNNIKVSDYHYAWLLVLVKDRLDLVTL